MRMKNTICHKMKFTIIHISTLAVLTMNSLNIKKIARVRAHVHACVFIVMVKTPITQNNTLQI